MNRPRDDLKGWRFQFRNTTRVKPRWARGWVVCAKPVKIPVESAAKPSKPETMPSKPLAEPSKPTGMPGEGFVTTQFTDCIWQQIGGPRTHAAENYPPFCPPGKVLRRIDFKGLGGPQITEIEKVECCALK